MSLLEDVFLQDEAGEAQELERIIEGDDEDERPREASDSDENSAKEDEAEEDKRRVDPSSTKAKRVVKNPRFVLNPARLTGPRGISVIPEHFKDFKFKGKGHEKEDLDLVLKKLEHWAYRLYPKFKFEDCLKKIETLGKKRTVSVHLTKIRSDQLISDDTVVQRDSSDEENLAAPLPVEDEFDQLLQQQIELAKATPRPGDNRSPFMAPKATSSPSISDEQRERMIRNRKLAEERRLARLKAAENGNTVPTVDLTNGNTGSKLVLNNRNTGSTVDLTVGNTVSKVDLTNSNIDKDNEATGEVDLTNAYEETRARKNRSNVIDSSDEEGELTINEEVTVDAYKTKENMIDLAEIHKPNNITSDDVELVISGQRNKKKKVVNSDDAEQINVVTKNANPTNDKLIDLTEILKSKRITSNDVELVITGQPNAKKNVIVSDDDDEMNVNTSDINNQSHKVVDLTEGYPAQRNIHSNEINIDTVVHSVESIRQNTDLDSSDEEDNVLAVSEAIVVDIHHNNTNDTEKTSNKTVLDKLKDNTHKIQHAVTENVEAVDSIDDITNVDDKINKNRTFNEIDDTEMNVEQNNDDLEGPTANETVKAAKNMIDDDDLNTDKTNDKEKENVASVSKNDEAIEEDFMDVDFSDDL
ncbi:hypothetical protein O0L34_g1844 [Tuta absoluta]|nr:hypothetical protein O0L34_g1844 [Tuta absoluta]